MKKLFKQIVDMLAASAFAEIEGTEAVRDMLLDYKEHGAGDTKGDVFAAIAFAEAGEFETAKQLMGLNQKESAPRQETCRRHSEDCLAGA